MKKIHVLLIALLLVALPKITLAQANVVSFDSVLTGRHDTVPAQLAGKGLVICHVDVDSVNPCSYGYHHRARLDSDDDSITVGPLSQSTTMTAKVSGNDSPGMSLEIKSSPNKYGPYSPVNFTYSSAGPCYTLLTDMIDQGSHVRIYRINNKTIRIRTIETDNGLMPVELMAFSANRKNHRIWLKWKTATETNCFSFVIEQSLDEINWTNIGTKMGQGTVNTPTDYYFDTEELSFNDVYYRLKQLDRDGTEKTYQTIKVASAIIPNKIAITAVYPNPITSQATIIYRLDEEATINMFFTNIEGRFIDPLKPELNSIINGEQKTAGSYSVNFIPPAILPSGVYFIHLTAGKNFAIHKLIIQK